MREEFWDMMCSAIGLWRIALAVLLVMLVFTLGSLPFLHRGTATYVISIINLIVAVPLLCVTIYVLRTCTRRRKSS